MSIISRFFYKEPSFPKAMHVRILTDGFGSYEVDVRDYGKNPASHLDVKYIRCFLMYYAKIINSFGLVCVENEMLMDLMEKVIAQDFEIGMSVLERAGVSGVVNLKSSNQVQIRSTINIYFYKQVTDCDFIYVDKSMNLSVSNYMLSVFALMQHIVNKVTYAEYLGVMHMALSNIQVAIGLDEKLGGGRIFNDVGFMKIANDSTAFAFRKYMEKVKGEEK